MEANELMIEDIIRFKHINNNGITDPHEITCIDGFNNEIHADGEIYDLRFWNIEPIPLTPEILEKNGFECKHKGETLKRLYWILNVEGGSVKVKINRGLFLFNIFGVPFQHGFYTPSVNKHIQYVHDFQHALRLCGIEKTIEL